MEILNMHAQFEELAAEMQKLSGAAALIDQTAQSSSAVVEQGGELVEAASLLIGEAQAAVAQAAEKLGAAATSLDATRKGLDAAYERQSQQADARTERVETAIQEATRAQGEQQGKAAGLVRDALTQTDGHVQSSAERVVQAVSGVLKQQGTKLDETRDQILSAGRVGRQTLADDVGRRIGNVSTALVGHEKTIRTKVEEARAEREASARRTTRLLILVVVLQIAALSAVLLM